MKQKVLLCIICSIFLLTACGSVEQIQTSKENELSDWTKGFVWGEKLEEELYSAVSYTDVPHETIMDVTYESNRITRIMDQYFYTLRRCYKGITTDIRMEKYVGDTSEYSSWNISFSDWNLEAGELWSFDVVRQEDNEEYVFTVGTDSVEIEKGIYFPSKTYIIRTDAFGKMLNKFETTQNGDNGISYQNVYADGAGRLFLVENDLSTLRVFSGDGELLFEQYYPLEEGNEIGPIGVPFRSEDGSVIIPFREKNITKLMWLNAEQQLVELASIETDIFSKWYTLVDDELFYKDKNDIIKWNIKTGQRMLIYKLDESGADQTDSTTLCIAEDDSLIFRVRNEEEDWTISLSAEQIEPENPITVAILCEENKLLNSSAAEFSRKNPLYPIQVEEYTSGDGESYADKILLELIAGKGPDIIYVSYEDMKMLADKGVLDDLGEYISDENLDVMIPGAIEMGTWKDIMYGIIPDMYVNTLLTTKSTWNKESWTIEDVMELAGENDSLQELFSMQFDPMAPQTILYYLLTQDMEHLDYIDWASGQSNFEEKHFDELLLLLQRYNTGNIDRSIEGEEKVSKGTSLAFYDTFFEVPGIFRKLSKLGEAGHAVGWPSSTGKGNYIFSNGILVVNHKTEHKETVSAYLNYLLSVEIQTQLEQSISVRKDILDYTLLYSEERQEYFWNTNGHGTIQLDKKKDGTTFTEEYLEFLNSCTPSYSNDEVYTIIEEESNRFFDGEIDALQATEIIDNRVQIYLDERK